MKFNSKLFFINHTTNHLPLKALAKEIHKMITFFQKKYFFSQIDALNIAFLTESHIKKLNAMYHKKNSSTDVLIFTKNFSISSDQQSDAKDDLNRQDKRNIFHCLTSFEEQVAVNKSSRLNQSRMLSGDIAISLSVVEKNVSKTSLPYLYLIYETILHGLLHLIGLRHDYKENSLQEIYILQATILEKLCLKMNII